MAPQSGQVQVIPLQVMPQKFSSIQSEHIMNPQRQVQQKSCSRLQVAHTYFKGLRHLARRPSLCGSVCSVMSPLISVIRQSISNSVGETPPTALRHFLWPNRVRRPPPGYQTMDDRPFSRARLLVMQENAMNHLDNGSVRGYLRMTLTRGGAAR